MKTSIQALKMNKGDNLPKDAILVAYYDHYLANSGDEIFITDNGGKLMHDYECYFRWSEYGDDRGLLSLTALTSEGGAFRLYAEFKGICEKYVKCSSDLKDWDSGKSVYNIEGIKEEYRVNGSMIDKTFYGIKSTLNFEESSWYRRCAKRSKPTTVEAKKVMFEKEQKERNESIRKTLETNKDEARAWFVENGISVRIAYLFLKGFVK